MLFEDQVSADFAAKVKSICADLGFNPDYLMAIMYNESRFKPDIVNSIGATGLIQFLPSTAKGLGTTTADLAVMDGVEQLDWVKAYYENVIKSYGTLKSLSDCYMAVFYPAAIPHPETYRFSPAVSKANPIFDLNKDGTITKAEFGLYITNLVKAAGGKFTNPAVAAVK